MTEWRYIAAFAAHFSRCGLRPDEVVAILSETQSRSVLVETARLAAQSLGAATYDVVVPTPASSHPVPIRSTGASQAIAGNRSVIAALASADLVVDCTVEGLLHAPELGQILNGGAQPRVAEFDPPRKVRIPRDAIERVGMLVRDHEHPCAAAQDPAELGCVQQPFDRAVDHEVGRRQRGDDTAVAGDRL